MIYITMEYIHAHSRIDYDCEDATLQLYADAAEETVLGYLNRGTTPQEAIESLKEQYGKIPARIFEATLLLIDHMYQFRGVVTPQNLYQVPYSFDLLLKPLMKL